MILCAIKSASAESGWSLCRITGESAKCGAGIKAGPSCPRLCGLDFQQRKHAKGTSGNGNRCGKNAVGKGMFVFKWTLCLSARQAVFLHSLFPEAMMPRKRRKGETHTMLWELYLYATQLTKEHIRSGYDALTRLQVTFGSLQGFFDVHIYPSLCAVLIARSIPLGLFPD